MKLWMPWLVAMTLTVPAFGLDFESVQASARQTPDVLLAQMALEDAQAKVRSLEIPGSFTLGLAPKATSTAASPFESPTAYTLGADLSAAVPIGLSADQRESLEAARVALAVVSRALKTAESRSLVALAAAYHATWSAQEYATIAQVRLDLAEREADNARILYASGDLSQDDLTKADLTYRQAAVAAQESVHDHRAAWIELASMAGLDWQAMAVLEPIPLRTDDLPRPPELSSWADTHHPDLLSATEAVTAAQRALAATGALDFDGTFRLGLSGPDQDFSASINPWKPVLNLGYGLPDAVFGTAPSGGSAADESWTWSVGASMYVGFGPEASATREILERDVDRAVLKAETTRDEVYLSIRTAYQDYVSARDAADLAGRLLDESRKSSAVARERFASNTITRLELDEVLVREQESEYVYTRALGNQTIRILSAALDAAYLDQLMGGTK